MKFRLFLLLTTLYSTTLYSQCFDCGHSIGGHTEDYVVDIDNASDGIVLTFNPSQGWGRSIYKYDFNCNLIWSNDFNPDNSASSVGIALIDTTVDSDNNIYSIIVNDGGEEIIEGFAIEKGNSLIKLNSVGDIEWVRKISFDYYLKRKIHIWNDNVYVVGQLDQGVENYIGLTLSTDVGGQYFAAKFNSQGTFIDSQLYGSSYNDYFYDSQIDENGNIYFVGITQPSSIHYPYLMKIDASLNFIWNQELTNYLTWSFMPWTVYYNNSNQKLYIWSKYYNVNGTSNGCYVGSTIMEVSTNDGSLENQIIIENCGFESSVGNGIGNVDERSFMTHEGDNLYVLSSFRDDLTVGNETLTSSQATNGEYNSELVLFNIDLNNFTAQIILHSEGENYYPDAPYYDLAGPIVAYDESIYITSSFMSYPMTINGNVITNNSGNNARDILYYKHNLNQDNLSGLISFENTCFSYATEFEINGDFDSVLWNFDDSDSGLNNTSTLNNPNHTFTNIGNYNVTALVFCGTETETLNLEVVINDSPVINQITDIYACEDIYGSQISSSFDTTLIESDLVGSQSNLIIKYFDGNGIELPSPLPNPLSNSVVAQETITARVAYNDNLSCFTEVSFNLIVNPLPQINQVNNIYACDDDEDGITEFDISNIESIILDGQTGMTINFFFENGIELPTPLPNSILNAIPNQETITARITNPNTNCYSEISFDLIVNPLPIAHSLDILYGCDDNNDGISEYFDTSNVESQVLNGQIGMVVSYFDQNGSELTSPLPNNYTNSNPYNEVLTIRVTDIISTCYAETTLQLETVTQPNINQPDNLYACDEGNGYAEFDTSNIEQQIIGTQTGLIIQYYDSNNNPLPSSFANLFQNTEPFSQTINVRVEYASNPICYSETSFDLVVNELSEINLEQEYFICNLEPSIFLTVNSGFYSYSWFFEDGTLISDEYNAEITEEGSYTLTVTQIENGITCHNLFTFSLIRSVLPEIQQINYGELGNNFIEIIASGNGNFEYSIDGINYQDSNYFPDIQGGTYNAYVRDKEGCGEDSKEVTIIDYPKFFTPNDDGYNDFWQVKGINKFPNSEILIFDRYGKILTQLSSNDVGWDGNYNGKGMLSNDYWFKANLGNGTIFSGHFSLKR